MEFNTGLNNLMKSRSIGSCIKSGFSLYADNFRKILKSSWPAALLFSILFSIAGTIAVIHIPAAAASLADAWRTGASTGIFYGLTATLSLLFIAGGLAETLFYSCGISLLRTHSRQGVIQPPARRFSFDFKAAWRTIKATVSCVLLSAVSSIIIIFVFVKCTTALTGGFGTAAGIVTCVAILLAAILSLPLLFAAMKYLFDDDVHLIHSFPRAYATGMRHIGLIAAVTLVNIIFLTAAGCVLQLPASILFAANVQAYLGAAYGDPLGMPAYIVPLTAFIFLLSGFLMAYTRMAVVFSIYYMYGSIETREEERGRFKTAENISQQ